MRGDPLLALFEPQRVDDAVRCFTSLPAGTVPPRGAIVTGIVSLAGPEATPDEVEGEPVDLARVLVRQARPGWLLVDEETTQLTAHSFQPVPDPAVKGRSEPIRLYEIGPPPGTLNRVYGSMLDAMGAGTAPTEEAKQGLSELWDRSVGEGRWLTRATPASTAGPAVGEVAAGGPADPVDCTVFAPPEVAPGVSFLVQVFAHVPESAAEATALAAEMDPDARRRGFRSLEVPVARGERIDFELSLPGLEIDDPVQSLVWASRPEAVQFGVSVPASRPEGTVIGTLTVARRTVPIGHLKFTLRVARAPARASGPEPRGDDAHRYTQAFVSYASADRRRVLERVQMLGVAGIGYFQDVLDLDPGERWERRLYERIAECDLFLLFWSRHAKESEWVRKEVAEALARKGGDDLAPPEIRPVILEGPPIPRPPPELAHLHFGDRLVYFMVDD